VPRTGTFQNESMPQRGISNRATQLVGHRLPEDSRGADPDLRMFSGVAIETEVMQERVTPVWRERLIFYWFKLLVYELS
jgi:hypothetical protein